MTWQRINRKHRNARKRIARAKRDFGILIRNFRKVADRVKAQGGKIAFEWPTECELWKDPEVMEMLGDLTLLAVRFHGCALGLVGHNGVLNKKPWTVQTNCEELRSVF